MKTRRARQVMLVVGVAVILTGCAQKNFKEPIAKFQKSTDEAAAAISSYYTELNRFERDLYFQERLVEPETRVLLIDETGKPTLLLGDPFDPESIQARIALIRQIAIYGEKLSDLAGNDAPDRFKMGVTELKTSLGNLVGRFEDLANKPDNPDKAAKDYVEPIGSIVDVIGQTLIERKRQKALKLAILNGEKPITEILDFLERDLKKYVESTQRTGRRQALSELVNKYNNTPNRDKRPWIELKMMLDEIQQAAEAVRIVSASQPADVVIGMREVYRELIKAAKAPPPSDLGSIISALEEYEAKVKELGEAVIKLRELNL